MSEVGPDGIRINNVSPGVTRSPMNELLPDSMLSAVAAHAALKRQSLTREAQPQTLLRGLRSGGEEA
ncbi:SDR family oxidoreductase [Mesorhizobium australafricanum]|uniref:SDR family oxidoreductase n=1 Tax=Mesorhizobium australafricanum TaxID=3072311 RepID=UPI003D324355